jgi:hypothetical protein
MHVRAEYGEAAHTAYKGRLESWCVKAACQIGMLLPAISAGNLHSRCILVVPTDCCFPTIGSTISSRPGLPQRQQTCHLQPPPLGSSVPRLLLSSCSGVTCGLLLLGSAVPYQKIALQEGAEGAWCLIPLAPGPMHYSSFTKRRHLDTNGDGMLSRQEVQHIIAALAPGGGGDAAAAQEVMDTVADPQTGSIDFSGFLHFFSMVRRA